MDNKRLQKILLIISAIGLVPIALGYGLMPEKTLTPLFGFSLDSVNLVHIMRAFMGLYIGQLVFWLLGASKPELRKPAMYSLIFFMLGLAGGRILSLVIDGLSHWLLIVYLVLELTIGFIGLWLIMNENKTNSKL